MTTDRRVSWIGRKLANAHPTIFSAYCIVAAFGTYFCMYGFRKPFAAGTYEDIIWLGIGFKTILVAAQVTGYMLSKFIGIKVVSEMRSRYRAVTLLGLIGIAELALLMFAVTPPPWNFVWLFANGLPLGMVFGLVMGFLEGRQVTEFLAAGLCASFIVASGFVKSVGRTLIQQFGMNEFWMPFSTGLLFLFPLAICVFMLSQIPPPDHQDEVSRTRREPMNRVQRLAFFRKHMIGLCGLLTIYVLLTIVRSIRDDFAVEIWRDMGIGDEPTVFARSEFWVMIGVVLITGMTSLIRNNRTAFLSSIGMLILGFGIVLISVWGYQSNVFSPMTFMVTLGLGLYVPYVALHTTVFERLIASFGEVATIGYLMCLADAVGYLGYVSVMVFRNLATGEVDFLKLMTWSASFVAFVASSIAIALLVYYRIRFRQHSISKEDLNPGSLSA